MATEAEAKQAILERLIEEVKAPKGGVDGFNSRTVLNLAEAYAWVFRPNQSHGGGGSATSS